VAVLRIPDENRSLREHREVRDYLAGIGIDYERWESPANLPWDASAEQVLSAYSEQVEELKREGGYVTADVIDVNADTPGLDAMLARFNIEHTHDETKSATSSPGAGCPYPSAQGPVVAIEVEAGDLIRVPRGRSIGSISAETAAYAPSVCSRTRLAGRRTTPAAAWTGITSQFAWVPDTFRRKRLRSSRRAADRRISNPHHSSGHRGHDNTCHLCLSNTLPLREP